MNFFGNLLSHGKNGGGDDASLSFPSQEVKLKFYISVSGAFLESISKYMQIRFYSLSFYSDSFLMYLISRNCFHSYSFMYLFIFAS